MRILVFGMTENPGGVESFLLNYYRHIDREKIQFDFLCNSYNPVAYEDELIGMGARTFHITSRRKDRTTYKKELEELFASHASEWSAVWENVCSLANIDYLKIAKKYGIRKRIIHSHNSQNMDSKLRGVLHRWNKLWIGKTATDFWACSEDAAKWFYSGKTLEKAVIIRNAIDVDRTRFDEEKRKAIRERYGWEDKFVIGNVGRLHFQKNQSFCLDIFSRYVKNHPESVLVIVGQGEDEQKLKTKARELGIEDSVCFTGVQRDIQAWLSSFDLFLFPSLFEGLSIVALEAQANGVPVLASKDVIPDEVVMNGNFVFFELGKSAEEWSRETEKMRSCKRLPYDTIKATFENKGYDINLSAGRVEDLLEQ